MVEHERALLGAIMGSPEIIASQDLTLDLFSTEPAARLFKAACRVLEQGLALDPITLSDSLRAQGLDPKAAASLAASIDPTSAANADFYRDQLAEARYTTKLKERLRGALERLNAPGADLARIAEGLQEAIEVPQAIFHPLDLTDLDSAELPDTEFAIEQLVPCGMVTLLGAHGGSGKTLLALAWAACVASGRHWAGLKVSKGKALYVSLEDAGPLLKFRLKRIAVEYGLDLAALQSGLAILDAADTDGALSIADRQTGRVVETSLMRQVRNMARGSRLIIIDNGSDGFDGDENRRREVRQFIRQLASLARAENAGLVLLVHIDKAAARSGGQGNNYSGSTAWHNSVRSRLAMEPDGSGVKLVQEKLNVGRKLDKPITLIFHGPALVPATFDPEADRIQQQDAAAALLEAMRKAIASGGTLPASRTSNVNFYATLKAYGLPGSLAGREAVYNALNVLLETGQARIETYKKDYKEKQRVII